jgi:hypothetical protein
VACLRSGYADRLNGFTREVLARSDVELRLIPGTGPADGHAPWTAPYPQGNKILAAAMPRDCDVSVFLDTDTVLVRPVDFAAELGAAEIAASVSDYASPGTDLDSWRSHYAVFGLSLPEERVTLRAGRRWTVAPYFNAGVVLFRERDADGRPTNIGADWLDVAARFDHAATADHDRVNIDQITLPILGYRRERPVRCLPQALNYNIQAFGPAPVGGASILHYHNLGILWADEHATRATLSCFHELMGPGAIEEWVDRFHPHARRRRLKAYLPEFAAQAQDRAA